LPDIRLYPAFLQGRETNANYDIVRVNGTAKLKQSDSGTNISFVALSDILKENAIRPDSLELIKIDTDGFDFDIILANEAIIKEYKPNLYFEYDTGFNVEDNSDSLNVIKLLESLEYAFVVYDNFGNLLNVVENNGKQEFLKLNHYLESARKYGGGFCYCDILATTNKQIICDILENDN